MLFIYLHGHQSVEPAGFIPHQQACIQSEPPLESPPLNLLSTPDCSVQSKSKACSSALHRPALPGPCLAAVSNLECSRCSRVTTAHPLIGSLMSAGFQVQGRDCCCCVLQRFTALSSTPSLLSAGEWRVEGVMCYLAPGFFITVSPSSHMHMLSSCILDSVSIF